MSENTTKIATLVWQRRHPLRVAFGWVAVTVFFLACTNARSPASTRSAYPRAIASVDDAPVASASASTPQPQAKHDSPFHVVGKNFSDTLVQAAGSTLVTGTAFGILQGNTFQFDPKYAKGLDEHLVGTNDFWVDGGRWPSLIFASYSRPYDRTSRTTVLQWTGGRWEVYSAIESSRRLRTVRPYVDGSVLLTTTGSNGSHYQFQIVGGTGLHKPPQPSGVKNDSTDVHLVSVDALESGHIFVAGYSDQNELIERLSLGAPAVIEKFPDVVSPGGAGDQSYYLRDHSIFAASPTDVWLSARWVRLSSKTFRASYLAHYDGSSWVKVAPPTSLEPFSIVARDAKGTLWADADEKEIWKRVPGGAWEQVFLPSAFYQPGASVSIGRIFVAWDGDVYVSVSKEGEADTTLLSTNQSAILGDYKTKAQEFTVAARKVAVPTTPNSFCRTPFVVLYAVSTVAPADFDYPATRQALAGHTEFANVSFVEYTRGGRRQLGAIFELDSAYYDWSLPKRMVEVVKKAVPGSNPEMVCYAPEVTRAITIDLNAGAPVPARPNP